MNKQQQLDEMRNDIYRVEAGVYDIPTIIKCDGKDQLIKQTIGKAPLSNLLEFHLALEEVSRVREYGKTKYPDGSSWRLVPDEDIDSAILRHMFNTKLKDNETGFSHKAHMITNLLFELQKEMEDDS